MRMITRNGSFNLFRGSGLTGFRHCSGAGRIIRPLLWAQRSEIQTWLRQQGQDWVEDSTNQESEYSRNWLRNELLPAVEERLNAQAVRHIDQAGRRIRQADAYLEEVAEEWLQKHAPDGKADAGALAEQAEIVQGYIVRRLFLKSKMPLRDVTETHVQAVRELLYQGTGKSISLPHGFRAVNVYGFLEVRSLSHPGKEKRFCFRAARMRIFCRCILSPVKMGMNFRKTSIRNGLTMIE